MRQIGAVALMVTDRDAAQDLHVDRLGFEVVEDVDRGRERWLTVRPPGSRAAPALATGTDRPPDRVAFLLETDDFARDHEAMTDAGVVFEEAPREKPYGTVAVWRDPFGNRWDLVQRRPR